VLLGFLAGCASAPNLSVASFPLPPPPLPPAPGAASPVTERLRALGGEWRPVRDGKSGRPQEYRLTIWGNAFSYGAGCAVTGGQLSDRGGGSYAIEAYGTRPPGCPAVTVPPPFEGKLVSLEPAGPDALRVTAAGRAWVFARVDPTAAVARDDFLRGEWLLADDVGRPYRGEELTRVSFGDGRYAVQAAQCSFETNGWIADRDWVVRPAGSQEQRTNGCRARTLGDRLAAAGGNVRLTAEPVEGRIRVRLGARSALLVPAARFPELGAAATVFPANDWALRLAAAAKALPDASRASFALRAVGLVDTVHDGAATAGGLPEARGQAFAGVHAAQYQTAQAAGLLPAHGRAPASLGQHLAAASIVALAVFEGMRPAERGDGLSLDYIYRVRESWRGGGRLGDRLIVRMPALSPKSRSPVITPEPGAEVLLLASRTGYLVQRLMDGDPPSPDKRIVSMTLPLMRVEGGRLVEAVEGTNVLGAASFAGTTLDQARGIARDAERRIARGGERRASRYFLAAIGGRDLPDPARLWIDYDADLETASTARRGAVAAWFDGCTVTRRTAAGWARHSAGCGGASPVSALGQTAAWIDENGLPDHILVSGPAPGPYEPLVVALDGGEVALRRTFE